MTPTLLRWASAWPARRWVVETRLLRTGHGRKTDGIDALSVAEIAAARPDLRQVAAACIEVGIGPFGPTESRETENEEARAPSRTMSERASPTVGVMKAGRGGVRLANRGFTKLADDQTQGPGRGPSPHFNKGRDILTARRTSIEN